MKKITLCVLFTLCNVLLMAQESSLTIHVTPGNLANELAKEQMLEVTELILIGEMNNSDFGAIKSNTYKLQKLDMKEVTADTIPEYSLSEIHSLFSMILPNHLNVIGSGAFWNCWDLSSVTWSNFPKKINSGAFSDCYSLKDFFVTETNEDCISIDGVLFSADKKQLLKCPLYIGEMEYNVPEGTEIIGANAFDDCRLFYVTLPASLKEIRDGAFWVETTTTTCCNSNTFSLQVLICNVLIPPKLIGVPFIYEGGIALYVPQESEELYRNTFPWANFALNGDFSSINQPSLSKVKMRYNEETLYLESDINLNSIEVIDSNGICIYKVSPHNNIVEINLQNKTNSFFLVRITYEDGTQEIKRIIK